MSSYHVGAWVYLNVRITFPFLISFFLIAHVNIDFYFTQIHIDVKSATLGHFLDICGLYGYVVVYFLSTAMFKMS